MGEPKVSYFGPFPWCCEITILSTDPSPQVSVWSVHENVISPRCDQFKNNQLPHRGEAALRWGKINSPNDFLSPTKHAPKISNHHNPPSLSPLVSTAAVHFLVAKACSSYFQPWSSLRYCWLCHHHKRPVVKIFCNALHQRSWLEVSSTNLVFSSGPDHTLAGITLVAPVLDPHQRH